uniref:MFS transporter n=1 Tax=candidate division WOR-3 bacterium TaxID=2052148 RepID=A0A7C4GGG2_UNCW3
MTDSRPGRTPNVDPVAVAAGANRSQLLPVLRIPEFVAFSISQAVSLFGDKLDYMALLAMIAYFAQQFHWESARAISWLSVVVALPTILFGPLAGILVDRWDRRKVMVVCDSFRTVLVLAIPLLALATNNLYLIYSIAFLVFLFGLFFNTARMSIIPNLVGQERVLGANSFMNLIGRVATFLGMVVGGLVVDWSGWLRFRINPVWTAGFYLDALTYLVSVIVLLVIFRRLADSGRARAAPPRRHDEVKVFFAQQSRMLREVRELWQVVVREPAVMFVYASILMFVLLGAAVFVLYIPIIQSAPDLPGAPGLGMGTRGVGYVAAIGSLGLVVSSIVFGAFGHRLKKHKVMLWSFLVLGLVAAGLAVSKSFAPVAPLAFIAGLALSPVNIGMDTLLHEVVPESARGRVFSTRDWLIHLLFALAALLIGQLTAFFPVRRLLFAVGVLVVAITIAGFFFTRGRRIA